MADDAETENIALSIRFVDERDYKKVFLPSPPGRRCWKKNRPSLFHLKDKSEDYSSSEAESSSKEYKYEAQSANRGDMPTLRSKVMVKAILTKAILTKVPALAPAKVQAKKSSNCCRYCRIIFRIMFSWNRSIRLRVISLTITRIHNTWIFLVLKLHCPIENMEYV